MQNIITLDYWFNLRPEPLLPFAQNFFIGSIALLAAVAILSALSQRSSSLYRGFFKRTYAYSLTNTIIGLLFLFFTYESVPFFSARFWLGLWAIVMIVWLVFILKSLKAIPVQKKLMEQEKEMKKYIP